MDPFEIDRLFQRLRRLRSGPLLGLVESDGQVPGIPGEVRVGRKDWRVVAMGDGANQHVDMRRGEPVGSAEIEEPSCCDVVAREVLKVAEKRQLFVERLKRLVTADA